MWGRNWKKMHIIFFIYIFLFRGKKKGGGGSALNIFSIFYTHHRIPNKHMMTINFDTITNNYEVIYVIKTVMKYHLKKIDTSFHQPLPNMVQRLFADVINDAIWFMNIHEQNHPWFLAMPYNIFFWWRTGPYTAIWPEVKWTICYITLFI